MHAQIDEYIIMLISVHYEPDTTTKMLVKGKHLHRKQMFNLLGTGLYSQFQKLCSYSYGSDLFHIHTVLSIDLM